MKRCAKCKSYHGIFPLEHLKENEDCGFVPGMPCKNCNEPLTLLEPGGASICLKCDIKGNITALKFWARNQNLSNVLD